MLSKEYIYRRKEVGDIAFLLILLAFAYPFLVKIFEVHYIFFYFNAASLYSMVPTVVLFVGGIFLLLIGTRKLRLKFISEGFKFKNKDFTSDEIEKITILNKVVLVKLSDEILIFKKSNFVGDNWDEMTKDFEALIFFLGKNNK